MTHPSIRNCPGAGRPSGMESFRSSSKEAQLSTKLETGILEEIKSHVTLYPNDFHYYCLEGLSRIE